MFKFLHPKTKKTMEYEDDIKAILFEYYTHITSSLKINLLGEIGLCTLHNCCIWLIEIF